MVKTASVNLDTVFEESIKVVKIAQRMEAESRKEIPDEDRLRMVTDAKENTKSDEEFDELVAEEKKLKRRIRFGRIEKVEIPQEKRSIVEKNYEIEKQAAQKILLERYQKLESYAKQFDEMETLIAEIIVLEDKSAAANYVQRILDGHVDKDPGVRRGFAPELGILTRFSHSHSLKSVKEKVSIAKKSVGTYATVGMKRNEQGAK
ncbi:hypothetical protein [Planococcus sp. ISL-110]|uniref:hypothetical protein n=1 Tax=Planococcus sp. ISL-110 TaxID=2819167 RepID=UPI001BEAEDC5|nr:hypothetical protein [Planococcus sp. ISL-110]MBT2569844.1 hypothetical protein [Planococcus sp. ISL-110]